MEVKSIGHVGVCVKNLEKAIDFYVGVMGLTVVEEPSEMVTDPEEGKAFGFDDCEHRICTLEVPSGQKIELVEFKIPKSPEEQQSHAGIGKHHISFIVDDIHAWVKKLEDAGAKSVYKPIPYETDEAESGTAYWVWMTDPDGIAFELMQF